MIDMSPAQARQALARWVDRLPSEIEGIARRAATVISGFATTEPQMRDAGTPNRPGAEARRRAPGDGGPLRIVTGTLKRAAGTDKHGVTGAINEIKTQGMVVTLTKGVDLGVVPYARIHEKGGRAGRGGRSRIPKRAYLAPAAQLSKPVVRKDGARVLTGSLRLAVGGLR